MGRRGAYGGLHKDDSSFSGVLLSEFDGDFSLRMKEREEGIRIAPSRTCFQRSQRACLPFQLGDQREGRGIQLFFSSATHCLALLKVTETSTPERDEYSAGDIVDDEGGLGSSVVHGGQAVVSTRNQARTRKIPFLASRIPDIELDDALRKLDALGDESGYAQDISKEKNAMVEMSEKPRGFVALVGRE